LNYALKNKNGDIGEYYFAYWITKSFGWPCRLLDIDLGLDAQVEICDEKHNVIGKFIAVQIKSTQSSKKSVSLSLSNLQYWKTMDDPVIVVRIINVTKKPKIYWKIINTESIDDLIVKAKNNKEKETSTTFSNEDLLTKNHKNDFRLLPALKNIPILERLSDKVITRYKEDILPFYDEKTCGYNMNTIGGDDDFIESFNRLCFEFDKVKACEYFDDIKANFHNQLLKYPLLENLFDEYRKLAITYIKAQEHNSITHILEQWSKHPYHKELASIVNDIKSI
jgi:hypothetical protein